MFARGRARIENVKLMAESGCKALFIGFESIDEETVRFTGKRQNRPSQYREVIEMLHEHGISDLGQLRVRLRYRRHARCSIARSNSVSRCSSRWRCLRS